MSKTILEQKKDRYEKLESVKNPKIDTNYLTNKIAKNLGIAQSSRKNKPDVIPPLKYIAVRYEKDEIGEFSLIRAIKNRLENEFCGNINKISKIEIIQDKKDLILKIW